MSTQEIDTAAQGRILAGLRRLSGAVREAVSPQEIRSVLVETLLLVPGVDQVHRLRVGADGVVEDAEVFVDAHERPHVYPPAEGFDPQLIRRVVAGRQALVFRDAGDSALLSLDPAPAFHIGSCVLAPLSTPGGLREVIVAGAERARAISEDDVILALTITDQASAALTLAEARAALRIDPLTGCLNEDGLAEVIEEEIARTERFPAPLSVLVLGLEGIAKRPAFDSEGLLRVIGTTLREQSRRYDAVGRRRGDEFALVLPAATGEGAQAVARRLAGRLAGLAVGLTFGSAERRPEEPGAALLGRAREAAREDA